MGVCRERALIPAPPSTVWSFLIAPENMHRWGPLTQPVTDLHRSLQQGDRFTQQRKDFFRTYSPVLLVEEIIPNRSIRLRDLSSGKLQGVGIISIEPDPGNTATWIQETVLYSLGTSWLLNWIDRWLFNPIIQFVASYKTRKAFRRLQAIFEAQQGHAAQPERV